MTSDSFEIRKQYIALFKKIQDEFGLSQLEMCSSLEITTRTLSDFLNIKCKRDIPANQVKTLEYFYAHLKLSQGSINGQYLEISKFLQKKKKDIERYQGTDVEKKEFLIKIHLMEEILEG
jgi:predicted XRE-type DNA-binding protein